MGKKYGSKSKTPVNRFSSRNRRRIGINITRRLPFELQVGIQRAAGRAVHRAMQSLVNAQIRRGNFNLRPVRRIYKRAKTSTFYKKK